MDNALLVRGFERIGDLPGDWQASETAIAPWQMISDSSSPSTSSMTRALPSSP